jgi:hypothetical protein
MEHSRLFLNFKTYSSQGNLSCSYALQLQAIRSFLRLSNHIAQCTYAKLIFTKYLLGQNLNRKFSVFFTLILKANDSAPY